MRTLRWESLRKLLPVGVLRLLGASDWIRCAGLSWKFDGPLLMAFTCKPCRGTHSGKLLRDVAPEPLIKRALL